MHLCSCCIDDGLYKWIAWYIEHDIRSVVRQTTRTRNCRFDHELFSQFGHRSWLEYCIADAFRNDRTIWNFWSLKCFESIIVQFISVRNISSSSIQFILIDQNHSSLFVFYKIVALKKKRQALLLCRTSSK